LTFVTKLQLNGSNRAAGLAAASSRKLKELTSMRTATIMAASLAVGVLPVLFEGEALAKTDTLKNQTRCQGG
jgi:hypothetical protein